MAKNKTLLDQIAASAESDQIIATVMMGKNKAHLPMMVKVKVAGDYVYCDIPSRSGIWKLEGDQLKAVGTDSEVESAFFPERGAELAQLQQLARKYGYTLAAPEGGVVRKRAPRGSKPKVGPRSWPVVGSVWMYDTGKAESGPWTVTSVLDDEKGIVIKSDTEEKVVTHKGMFIRYYKPVSK